ncbi:MAG: glutamate--tRNA ligase [Pseudomonadota bacterium]
MTTTPSTRFAPSPTGRLHVGNLRTAVLNWLAARAGGGRFVLRIDDTDTERSEERYVEAIRRDLDWLGLGWDAEVRQSERADLYAEAEARLMAEGRAYECFETPEELDLRRKKQRAMGRPPVYDRAALSLSDDEKAALRQTRTPHVRFLLSGTRLTWHDLVRGEEAVELSALSDPVLRRADGQLLYTLASVVDDAEMGITHVVRGADHVTNTAAQIDLFAALGATAPAFGHHSLLTGPDGEGLSKRLGSLSLEELREGGVEPLALVSMMARLGSSAPVEPVASLDGLVADFDLSRFGRAPTRFDPEELALHSARTLRGLPFEAVATRLHALGIPEAEAQAFWSAVGPNLDRLAEAETWWALCREGTKAAIAPGDEDFVETAWTLLPPRPWGGDAWSAWTSAVKAHSGRKGRALFLPLRRALTGRDKGPDMALLMPLLRRP